MDKITALYIKKKVPKSFVFGSILSDNFKKISDINLLIDSSEVDLYNLAANYFNRNTSLEKLLKSQTNLLENKAIHNPYLRKPSDSSNQMIYG